MAPRSTALAALAAARALSVRGVPVWSMEHCEGKGHRLAKKLPSEVSFGGRHYPSKQLMIQIELASSWAQLLNGLNHLDPASEELKYTSSMPELVRTLIASAMTCSLIPVSVSISRVKG